MTRPMRCKQCGTTEFGVSVFQNTFKQFPKGQYVFLCPRCYRYLKSIDCPMLYESYIESGTIGEFQDRLNQIM